MDTMKIIEKLAHAASKEQPPEFDVSNAVMCQIKALQQETVGFWPIEFFAGLSAVAASVVTLFSIHAWRVIVDPLLQLLAPLQEVPLW